MAEGGKDVGEAPDALSEEEQKIIQLIRTLKIKPQMDTSEDLVNIAKVLRGVKPEPHDPDVAKPPKPQGHQYPKISIFYGETGKGEVTWDTFKYEVASLVKSKTYSMDQIMYGIRRAVKGTASDKLRRLGPDVTPMEVIEKLEADYGTVENLETAMKKFYTCEQRMNETVESYATRLEELFYKAVELNGFSRSDTLTLKHVLHAGLIKEIKHMSVYQRDKIPDYDDFKMELRRIEADLKSGEAYDKSKPCKPTVPTEKKEQNEITELLQQLNERIGRIEKAQQEKKDQNIQGPQHWYSRRGLPSGRWRGGFRGAARGRGDPRDRGRGSYRPQRPFAGGTFSPTCYLCNKKGHVQFDCPTITPLLVCTNCKEKGHTRKECPN